jgi:hypothetical protein
MTPRHASIFASRLDQQRSAEHDIQPFLSVYQIKVKAFRVPLKFSQVSADVSNKNDVTKS